MGIQTRHKGLTNAIKTLENLSPRIQWLKDDYFSGVQRPWTTKPVPLTRGTCAGLRWVGPHCSGMLAVDWVYNPISPVPAISLAACV